MLGTLLKKQLMEVFRNYFYDAKKNKKRSKTRTILCFVFFIVLMVVILGGMFTALSLSLCTGLTDAGAGFLYFLIMIGISVVLGAFGSVFNTFSGLYLAKDNDFLLSMPIPVKYIVISRLLNVYILGAMYSLTGLLPAFIIYWIVTGITFQKVLCGAILCLCVTVFVLLLSCLLGFVIAKISVKLKRKSFVSVLLALAFIGAYYIVYFKASELIQSIILNAQIYGEQIKGSAYALYVLGHAGEGDFGKTVIVFAVVGVLAAIVWMVLKGTFLDIAISSGKTEKKKYIEKKVKEKGVFGAVLQKEFRKFASSPNYMLNCGFGIVMIPVVGVLLLIKGEQIITAVIGTESSSLSIIVVVFCAILFGVSSMNDMAAPSVSLEGKNIWILQSLPVSAKTVLRAKAFMHLILSAVPVAFTVVCAVIVLPCAPLTKILVCIATMIYMAFSTLFDSVLGVKLSNLTWTNELYPLKQGGAVFGSIFGQWGITALFVGLYFLVRSFMGIDGFLCVWIILTAFAAVLLLRWLDTKGAEIFEEL